MKQGVCRTRSLLLAVAVAALGGASAVAAPLHPGHNPLLLRVADVAAGKAAFESKCAICHTLEKDGATKFGPNLYGVFGARAGTKSGFAFSPAMEKAGKSGLVWNTKTLEAYLADPQKEVPGNRMPFPGLASKTERENLVAYLAQASR